MLLENDLNNYYEEYRGHVIASSIEKLTDEMVRTVLTVYNKSESSEFSFITGGKESKVSDGKTSLNHLVWDAREYIDALCCDSLNRGIEIPNSELPIVDLKGTDFYVDVTRFQLMEKWNSSNVIPFEKIQDYGDYYIIDYNKAIKNVREFPDSRDIEIPMKQFVEIDPEGMARKYNISVEEVKCKTDFDFMVDQKEYDLRVNQGRLPTIDIAGHLFYVDMRMNKLRPKDDFLSKGISFSEIDDHYSEERKAYLIPYDPKKHEFRALDYENITSIPTDLIAVAFPFQKILDPVGWNRQNGWYIKDDLKHIGVKGQFTAKEIDWNHTYIVDIIKDNLERNETISKKELKIEPKKGKGRKM